MSGVDSQIRSNDQIMEKIKEKVIVDHFAVLADRLTCRRHFPLLRSKYVLTRTDCENITSKTTSLEQNTCFLDLLLTKGQKGYDCLIDSMKEEGTQMEMVASMNTLLEEEWHRAFKRIPHQGPVPNVDQDEDEETNPKDLPPPKSTHIAGTRHSATNC